MAQSNATVAVQTDDGYVQAEAIAPAKGGWLKVRYADGTEGSVRTNKVLTDPEDATEDGDEDAKRGDVFPMGIRETYEHGKTEAGVSYVDCGDDLAETLRGSSLEQVAALAAKICGELSAEGWMALYTTDREEAGKTPLNNGMVRMNLGNRIRAAIKADAKDAAES